MNGALPVIVEAWQEFEKRFGRAYHPVETYKTDGAEILLLTVGSVSETAMTALDKMRADGKKVGLVRLRLWRPFPATDLVDVLKRAKAVAVVDRAMAFSTRSGPLCVEVKAALYDHGVYPYVQNFVAGLGGRDVTVEDFENMVAKTGDGLAKGLPMGYEMVNVRE